MNAIPLVFNAPKANINVNSVNGNSIRTNNKLVNATQGMNIGGAAGMLGGGGLSNEAQLRQEVNTSIVALKREAFSLETLIAQAAQTLQDVNKRLSELEGKQGDYVKKADATVASVGGDGKYISAISETDGVISATATDLGNMVPVNSVTSGNMHSVTSGAVYSALGSKANIETGAFYLSFPRSTANSVDGSYVKIGSVVFATTRVKITNSLNANDYVNIPASMPTMDVTKGCFGSWRTEAYNGYGTLQNSGTTSIWFIYNNQEFNVGQKAIEGGGDLQIELIYFT